MPEPYTQIRRIVVGGTETQPTVIIEFDNDESLTITADTLRSVVADLEEWVQWFNDFDAYAFNQERQRGVA